MAADRAAAATSAAPAPAPPQAPRHGLALSGGGANGAYEVGVLKALLAGKSPATGFVPLVPTVLTGTSIGSFNAAFLAAEWDTYGAAAAGMLEAVWIERMAEAPGRPNGAFRFRGDPLLLLEPRQYVPNPLQPFVQLLGDAAALTWEGVQRAVHFVASRDESLRQRTMELFDFTTFIAVEPWEQTIRDAIRFDVLRGCSRQLRVATTNWTTGEARIFANADMTDRLGARILMASSAIPGFFPPVMVGAEPHVDGGVLMNTPLKPAIEAGADVIHVVYLDPEIRALPLHTLQSTMSVLYRQQAIGWAKVVNDDVGDAAIINRAIDLLDLAQQGQDLGPSDLALLARALPMLVARVRQAIPYRRLAVHLYHPRDDLSDTGMGVLDLARERIEAAHRARLRRCLCSRLYRLGLRGAWRHHGARRLKRCAQR